MRNMATTLLLLSLSCGPGPVSTTGVGDTAESGDESTTGLGSEGAQSASSDRDLRPTNTSGGTSDTPGADSDADDNFIIEPDSSPDPPPPDPDPPEDCDYLGTPAAGLPAAASAPGDFDGDGILDVAGWPEPDVLQLYLGDGSGVRFQPGPSYSAPGGKMAQGDFDGNGLPDLVLYDLNRGEEGVRTTLNFDGMLGPPIVSPIDSLFNTFRVIDINGDGIDDISYGGFHSEPKRAALGADGYLTETHEFPVQACYVTGSDWADFDGDGRPDVALLGGCNRGIEEPPVTTYLQRMSDFDVVESATLSAGDGPGLHAADFDGDGVPDLATEGWFGVPALFLHRGRGDGTFEPREAHPRATDQWVRAKFDADGDGVTDLLTDRPAGIYRGTPDGFEFCRLIGTRPIVGDFDGDATPDVLVADPESEEWTLLRRP